MVQGQSLRSGDARATGRAGFLALASTLMLVLLLGIWLRPYILSFYHLEVGGQALEEALVAVFPDRLAPEQVVDGRRLESGAAHLQEAIRWDPRNFQARRYLARVYLSQGQPEAALEILQPALAVQPDSPLLHLELGDIYDSLGESEEAVRAYEAGRIGSRQIPLAANYLKLADVSVQVSSGEAAIELWRRTLRVDPGNLYALYRLAKIHREMGDNKTAKAYEEQLRRPSMQSVAVPQDSRSVGYQAQAMIGLVNDRTWEHQTMVKVVSYQVWQFGQGLLGLMTERVLQALAEQWPNDAALAFYRTELDRQQNHPGGSKATSAFDNRLANASFDYAQPAAVSEDDQFMAWKWTDFGDELQVKGWHKMIAGNGSPGALELGLSQATGYPSRIGVYQDCGEFPPGALVELRADANVPYDLPGAYTSIETWIYQPEHRQNGISVKAGKELATPGWVHLSSSGRVPDGPSAYQCTLVVHIVATQPLADVTYLARYDNIVLRQKEP